MQGMLKVDELRQRVGSGEIDTVLTVFPDHFGRLMGKRVTGEFFLDHVLPHGMHCCNYLLTVDVETAVMPGYEYANWETGYGDFQAVPDTATLRCIPWLPHTALVMCDLVNEEDGEPVEVSPRRILRRQLELAAEAGFTVNMGSELEFYLVHNTYQAAKQADYRNLTFGSRYMMDYDMLATTVDETLVRDIRNAMVGAGIPVEFSKGETGQGQHEINLRYADALAMADRHVIYKTGAKEIANQQEKAITFMAKPFGDQAGSSMHLHTSFWDAEGKRNLFWDESTNAPSETYRYFLGGQMAAARELCYFSAPTINSYKRYVAESWAPTRLCWAMDNRTTGFRMIGHGNSFRVENRMPGADANPYLSFAATIAAGLYGIRNKIDCGEPFAGNAYADDSLPQLPATLYEAIAELGGGKLADEAFGPAVAKHYLHTARLEQQAYDKAVTAWELHRLFERI